MAKDSGNTVIDLRGEPKLFFYMSLVCLAIVLAGFGMNIGLGRADYRQFTLAVYFHGIIYVSWCILAVMQPFQIARSKRDVHRIQGWIAVGIALTMGVSGLWLTIWSASVGRIRPANILMMLNILTIAGFWGMIVCAVIKRHNMAWHSRMMMCATIIITGPAWARLLPLERLGPQLGTVVISIAVLSLTIWGAIYDLRHRKRIHPAWYWGAGISSSIGIIGPPLSFLPPFTNWVATFAPA